MFVNFRRGNRHKRRNQNGNNAQRFSKVVHNGLQAFCLCRVFCQNPRCGFINIFIGAADKVPYILNSLVQFHMVHGITITGNSFVNKGNKFLINGFRAFLMRYNTAVVFFNHAYGAVQQVAKVVGKVGINAVNQCIAREVAVAAERNFAQQEVADSIRAKFFN